MTGGHGEWFVQDFGADGLPEAELAFAHAGHAAARMPPCLVAGSQAAALVALRGHGEALRLLPDARCLPLLPADPADRRPRPALRPPAGRSAAGSAA